jgi:hypothetical protein
VVDRCHAAHWGRRPSPAHSYTPEIQRTGKLPPERTLDEGCEQGVGLGDRLSAAGDLRSDDGLDFTSGGGNKQAPRERVGWGLLRVRLGRIDQETLHRRLHKSRRRKSLSLRHLQVGLTGFEPATSWSRSTLNIRHLATECP